jgi:hypothetical protein
VPPAAEWQYELKQNGQQGLARLSWTHHSGDYSLRLERELKGRPLPSWHSQGRVDEQGLAPSRFAQQRGRRDAAATNFRREEGLISFSANAELFELPAGVQDRLSWWLQLAALVDAQPPALHVDKAELRFKVVGLQGEAREWVFELQGREDLDLPAGPVVQALRLRRVALGPYSGEIDIWLDPARGHWPVRMVFRLPDERGWEIQLAQLAPPASNASEKP